MSKKDKRYEAERARIEARLAAAKAQTAPQGAAKALADLKDNIDDLAKTDPETVKAEVLARAINTATGEPWKQDAGAEVMTKSVVLPDVPTHVDIGDLKIECDEFVVVKGTSFRENDLHALGHGSTFEEKDLHVLGHDDVHVMHRPVMQSETYSMKIEYAPIEATVIEHVKSPPGKEIVYAPPLAVIEVSAVGSIVSPSSEEEPRVIEASDHALVKRDEAETQEKLYRENEARQLVDVSKLLMGSTPLNVELDILFGVRVVTVHWKGLFATARGEVEKCVRCQKFGMRYAARTSDPHTVLCFDCLAEARGPDLSRTVIAGNRFLPEGGR